MNTQDILDKYSARLSSQTGQYQISKDYSKFKKEIMYEPTRYERIAQVLGNLISIKLPEKDSRRFGSALSEAHVEVTPSQAVTLSIITLVLGFFLTLLASISIYLITEKVPLLFGALGFLSSLFLFYYTYTLPFRLSNAWKLSASSQMVPAILYIVVYMKHTSNLERAIAFASEHLEGPLALDFKKIFYDVEIGKYSTIKQSLDNYLEFWSDYSPEFVESMHLIESSLYEPSETRRVEILEKSLQVILDGVYEKMLKFSRDIRSPLTNIYMLGIILPTLALALLPLASALLGGLFKWYHIILLFNILIPFFVFYMASQTLLKRPGGYGESSVIELSPDYGRFKSKKPWIISGIVALPLLILGFLPFIFQIPGFAGSLGLSQDYTFKELGLPFLQEQKLFDFKNISGTMHGPFSILSVILSMLIPLSIALFFSLSYYLKTKGLVDLRESTKGLEREFTNSLFHLGNRLGDGIPAEIAFAKVSESSKGLATQQFFSLVNKNIQEGGMSLERAIFDEKRGAITFFSSPLIATSMRILVESVKKGLKIAAQSLMSISEYVKNIEKISQRLKDLLAEIVSDMKSNMNFLAPLLSGVVVGLAVMITSILNKLRDFQQSLPSGENAAFSFADITKIFPLNDMIPPYFLQIAIGIYIIQIVFILTKALVTIDSGVDKLKEKSEFSRNLKTSIILYTITSALALVVLTLLVSLALPSLA